MESKQEEDNAARPHGPSLEAVEHVWRAMRVAKFAQKACGRYHRKMLQPQQGNYGRRNRSVRHTVERQMRLDP